MDAWLRTTGRRAVLAGPALASGLTAAEARGSFDAGPIAWTQLGPSDLIARAVTTDPTCPIRVCEAAGP